MIARLLRPLSTCLAIGTLVGLAGVAHGAPDLGKRACAREAKRLCPAQMRSFSRKRVEACMIARIDQTSALCHSTMLEIKAQREATIRR